MKRARPSLVLVFVASLTMPACADDSALECSSDAQPTLLVGTATFEDEVQVFDEVEGLIVQRGPQDDPCIDHIEVIARNDTKALSVGISVNSDGSSGFAGASYGRALSPPDYGLYPDDTDRFTATWSIPEIRDGCGQGSVSVFGTAGRMYLNGSEDFGPYSLDDVDIQVEGLFRVEWYEGTCD